MIGIFSYFSRVRAERELARLIREVSDISQDEVWDRVRHRIFDMGFVEARGYVRARATDVVRRKSEVVLLARQDVDAATRARLCRYARERVIQLVVGNLAAGSPVARRVAA